MPASLEMLPENQRTGDIFFPRRWLDATLGGHSSKEAAAIVTGHIGETERTGLSPRLLGQLRQSADELLRSQRILAR